MGLMKGDKSINIMKLIDKVSNLKSLVSIPIKKTRQSAFSILTIIDYQEISFPCQSTKVASPSIIILLIMASNCFATKSGLKSFSLATLC